MHRRNTKVFLLLFASLASMFDSCVSTRIQSACHNLSQELTLFSPLFSEETKDIAMTLSRQSANYKRQNELFDKEHGMYKGKHHLTMSNQDSSRYRNRNIATKFSDLNSQLHQKGMKHGTAIFTSLDSLLTKSSSRLFEEDKASSRQTLDRRLEKRNADIKNVNRRNGMSIGNQKDAKALGRLLMNDAFGETYGDIQDVDYVEDEDDDYSKGMNRKKMRWENFRNEDGASIMELIALNVRHKTNMYHVHDNDYFY